MKDRKKAAEKVADNVFDMAQQIVRNYQEDYGFVEVIDWLKDNHFRCKGVIPVGSTPNALALGGADLRCELVVTPGTVAKCLSSPEERRHGHSLNRDIFKQVIRELRNPILLLKGSKPGTLVVVTDLKDKEDCPIIVSVALNRVHRHHLTNQITSVYGKRDFEEYISRQLKQDNLIAINKNKANKMFRSIGLQLPGEETLISFDNSIAYTFKNVNSCFGNNLKSVKNNVIVSSGVENNIDYIDELEDVLIRLNSIIKFSEDVVEMVNFFEYAGPEIRDSVLWHQFQQDKDYLSDNVYVSRLNEIISDARCLAGEVEKTKSVREKIDDLFL